MLRIFKFYWPVLLSLIAISGFTVYLKTIPDTECHFTFGQSTELLALYQLSYAFPALVLIFSVYTFVFGLYGLKQGKYPPDGFPIFVRKTRYGLSAKLTSITGILLPVLAVYSIYLGIESVNSVADGKSHAEINQLVMQQCSRR